MEYNKLQTNWMKVFGLMYMVLGRVKWRGFKFLTSYATVNFSEKMLHHKQNWKGNRFGCSTITSTEHSFTAPDEMFACRRLVYK
jgi:hypothetical protein